MDQIQKDLQYLKEMLGQGTKDLTTKDLTTIIAKGKNSSALFLDNISGTMSSLKSKLFEMSSSRKSEFSKGGDRKLEENIQFIDQLLEKY